jgi:hypothetical protein
MQAISNRSDHIRFHKTKKMSLTTGNLVSEFLSSLFVPFLYIEKNLNFSKVVKTFKKSNETNVTLR